MTACTAETDWPIERPGSSTIFCQKGRKSRGKSRGRGAWVQEPEFEEASSRTEDEELREHERVSGLEWARERVLALRRRRQHRVWHSQHAREHRCLCEGTFNHLHDRMSQPAGLGLADINKFHENHLNHRASHFYRLTPTETLRIQSHGPAEFRLLRQCIIRQAAVRGRSRSRHLQRQRPQVDHLQSLINDSMEHRVLLCQPRVQRHGDSRRPQDRGSRRRRQRVQRLQQQRSEFSDQLSANQRWCHCHT